MRAFYFLGMLTAVAACDSGVDVQPAAVLWMEWPAEVVAAKPFTVRQLMAFPSCHRWVFQSAVSADQSAVTFAPYFLVERGEPVCLPVAEGLAVFALPNLGLDTAVTAPGLATAVARTFEIRGVANVDAPTPSPSAGNLPVRTFGDVTVRLSNPDTSRRNVAGVVTLWVENGCARIRPGGYFAAPPLLVLEDQADTARFSYAFVRGYMHASATPICGETRVFELLSRN